MDLESFLDDSQKHYLSSSKIMDDLPKTTQKYVMKLITYFPQVTCYDNLDEFELVLPQVYRSVIEFSNILGIRLSNHVEVEFDNLGGNISLTTLGDMDSFPFQYVKKVSNMSKAAESIDHLEDYPVRKTYKECLVNIVEDLFELSQDLGIELEELLIE